MGRVSLCYSTLGGTREFWDYEFESPALEENAFGQPPENWTWNFVTSPRYSTTGVFLDEDGEIYVEPTTGPPAWRDSWGGGGGGGADSSGSAGDEGSAMGGEGTSEEEEGLLLAEVVLLRQAIPMVLSSAQQSAMLSSPAVKGGLKEAVEKQYTMAESGVAVRAEIFDLKFEPVGGGGQQETGDAAAVGGANPGVQQRRGLANHQTSVNLTFSSRLKIVATSPEAKKRAADKDNSALVFEVTKKIEDKAVSPDQSGFKGLLISSIAKAVASLGGDSDDPILALNAQELSQLSDTNLLEQIMSQPKPADGVDVSSNQFNEGGTRPRSGDEEKKENQIWVVFVGIGVVFLCSGGAGVACYRRAKAREKAYEKRRAEKEGDMEAGKESNEYVSKVEDSEAPGAAVEEDKK